MFPSIHIVHGPNLNLVGLREPEIYGKENLEAYLEKIIAEFSSLNISVFQSNHEGEIIDYLQKILSDSQGIIINAGAYTHTSIALRDTLALFKCPIIEVHISDLSKREKFRQYSFVSDHAWSIIQGHGLEGYKIALARLMEILN